MVDQTVWVLGSSNIDLTHNVDTLPEKGQTLIAGSCLKGTGGKGANQAIAAAHMGCRVRFIGAVGDDPDGQVLLNSLKTRHIDTKHVRVSENEKSGNAVIFVDRDGNNLISVFPGANQHIPLSAIDEGMFRSNDFLVAQLEVNLNVVEKAFETAQIKHVTTILNPSPYQSLNPSLLSHVDIMIVNESEGQSLSGVEVKDEISAKACASRIRAMGAGSVIVTLGEAGVVLATPVRATYFQGHTVDVVDTQGAGDCFLGSMVSKLYQGESIENAVAAGNYAAALSVTKPGSTQVCLPDPEVLHQIPEIKSHIL